MALVITKWLSLGDGSTPDKPEWAMHSKIERWTNANNANDNAPIRIEPHGRAGARACFEKSTTLPLKNLRSRNFSYLTGHRYKTCMIKRDLTNWCIPRNVSKEGVSYWDRILGLQW
ncbi:hypothetical protein N7528_004776 [Penicillium herquei]|nr:hypothetical protein N7528_004776 [Penicillium herquei]